MDSDAVIMGAMKSASRPTQAKVCAVAVAAGGSSPDQAVDQSCYSPVAPGLGISIAACTGPRWDSSKTLRDQEASVP
jgi:hypothetical protein